MLEISFFIFSIVGLGIFLLPLILTWWLWKFHDKEIQRLEMELLDVEPRIQRESVGRGRTAAGIVPLIEAARRPIQLELEKRRVKRQLFLDRARLASLLKIN